MATDSAVSGAGRAGAKWRFGKVSQEQIILIVTLVLFVTFSFLLKGFATVENIIDILDRIAILGILGLGMGLIIISRGIDLSEVAIMCGPWAIAMIEMNFGMPVFLACILAALIAIAIGLINGMVVAFADAPALFVTLASSFVIYGAAYWFAPAYVVYAPNDAPALLFLGNGLLFGIPMPIVVFALCALAVHFFLSRTSTGLFIYSQGDNPEAARLTGIAIRPLIVLEYVMVAGLAWLAGLVRVGMTKSVQMNLVLSSYIFDVILVVVLGGISLVGGRGSVFSVIVGCALIGVLVNAFTIMNINNDVQDIIRGVVLLAAIIIDNRLHPRDDETARQGD
jgi:ribose transport system permease protein